MRQGLTRKRNTYVARIDEEEEGAVLWQRWVIIV